MNPDYHLDARYNLVPRKGYALPEQMPEMPYENLPERCAVSIADWIPKTDQKWSIEGVPTCSICLILEGCGTFSIAEGQSYALTPGSVFIFRTQKPTVGVNEFVKGHRNLFVDFRYPHSLFSAFENRFLNDSSDEARQQPTLFQKRQITKKLLRLAHEILECRMTGIVRELFLRGKALEVLSYLADETPKIIHHFQSTVIREQLPIRMARQILEERYFEQWSLNKLAKEVGVNERKLKQGFRALLETTYHSCLQEIRLKHACRLLSSSKFSVTDIAIQVGYSNSSHFARVFRENRGNSPRSWREQHACS